MTSEQTTAEQEAQEPNSLADVGGALGWVAARHDSLLKQLDNLKEKYHDERIRANEAVSDAAAWKDLYEVAGEQLRAKRNCEAVSYRYDIVVAALIGFAVGFGLSVAFLQWGLMA